MGRHYEHEHGFGIFLRFGGCLVPPLLGFSVSVATHENFYGPSPAGLGADVLRVIGFPWGWIYGAYRPLSLLFGLTGLFTLVFLGLMARRRDWVGCTGVLLWSISVSWLIAGVMTRG